MVIASILRSIIYTEDRGSKMTFETQELSPQQKADLGRLGGEFLYVGIKKEPFVEQDLAKYEKQFSKPAKSQSQKLRQHLFRLWQEQPDGFSNPEEHYNFHMDQFIKQVRDKF